MQVAEAIHRYGREQDQRAADHGGQSIRQQLRVLDRGVHVVVATPGRALDHLQRETRSGSPHKMVVLDEADEMRRHGPPRPEASQRLPATRQTALFSATMAPRIQAIARKHLKDPVTISIARERTQAGEMPRVRQVAYLVQRQFKPEALGRVLDMETPTSAIVFCRTRIEVDELTEAMNAHGYRAEALHGGFAQEQRDRVMKRFRANKADLLIVTDVARGPRHPARLASATRRADRAGRHVHRIGRTGRAGVGVATLRRAARAAPAQHPAGDAAEDPGREHPHRRRPAQPAPADARPLRETLVAGEPTSPPGRHRARDRARRDAAAAAVKVRAPRHHQEGDEKGEEQDPPLVSAPAERHAPGDERYERKSKKRGPRAHGFEVARLFIGAGRLDSLRPGDLVGAIANEAGIDGEAIGAIKIADRFALVEVPEEFAEVVIQALRNTQIRGRRVTVRRDLMS
jgi:ATP-dependent RNA helicase DeaD